MLPGGIREAIRRKHEKYVLKLAGRKGLRGAEDWAPELQSVVRAALEKSSPSSSRSGTATAGEPCGAPATALRL